MTKLYSRFKEMITTASKQQLLDDHTLSGKLNIAQEDALQVTYAPFEHIEKSARLVILGITPGAQQASNALIAMKEAIENGDSDEVVLKKAKVHASFSGGMRTNLIKMLDHIGINNYLAIRSAESLWGENSHLVHFSSAIRNPVLLNGKNYNGTPSISKNVMLQDCINNWLLEEVEQIQNCIWLSLGPKPNEALQYLVKKGSLSDDQVINGLPHPSGANAERIAYFLGQKERNKLSTKTNPQKIDEARNLALHKIANIS